MNKEIGKITNKIIKILKLDLIKETPIFIGEANLNHMKNEHPKDFEKYNIYIKEILKSPTYLARNSKKEFNRIYKKI